MSSRDAFREGPSGGGGSGAVGGLWAGTFEKTISTPIGHPHGFETSTDHY